MGRRRSNLFYDLVSLAAALPWWVSVVLAGISFGALRWLALLPVPAPSGLEDMGFVVVRQVLVTGAQFGQFVVPIAVIAGLVMSRLRRVRAAHLLDAFAENGPPGRFPRKGRGGKLGVSWREFETLVGESYRRQGYEVAETKGGADGGVDLVLRRGNERVLVQCKHWQAQTVGVKVVRELKGVVAHAGGTGGAVVTSGRFTTEAVTFAREADIDLVDGVKLKQLAKERRAAQPDPVRREPFISDSFPDDRRDELRTCPRCGSRMVVRQAKRGPNAGRQFWGCRRFPACKATMELAATDRSLVAQK